MKWCLQVDYRNGEPKPLFDLEDDESAAECFNLLNETAEDEPRITLLQLTEEQWDKFLRLGEDSD